MDRIIEKLHHLSTSLRVGEENGIRYMAGYLAVKLFRRYKKSVMQPYLQTKSDMFLKEWKPDVEQVDSLSDYTTLWSELIDRGGLYHISDKAYVL